MFKTCKKCSVRKGPEGFYRNSGTKDGLEGRCKACALRSKKEGHIRDPRKQMLRLARHRASKKNLAFSLQLADIVVPERCPALGTRLIVGDGSKHDFSPTLDRIVPEAGYVRGNVQVISDLANRIKNNATASQIKAVAKYLEALDV